MRHGAVGGCCYCVCTVFFAASAFGASRRLLAPGDAALGPPEQEDAHCGLCRLRLPVMMPQNPLAGLFMHSVVMDIGGGYSLRIQARACVRVCVCNFMHASMPQAFTAVFAAIALAGTAYELFVATGSGVVGGTDLVVVVQIIVIDIVVSIALALQLLLAAKLNSFMGVHIEQLLRISAIARDVAVDPAAPAALVALMDQVRRAARVNRLATDTPPGRS